MSKRLVNDLLWGSNSNISEAKNTGTGYNNPFFDNKIEVDCFSDVSQNLGCFHVQSEVAEQHHGTNSIDQGHEVHIMHTVIGDCVTNRKAN
jgi:hypothetical protein